MTHKCYKVFSVHVLCVCLNSTCIKRSISLKRSWDRPWKSTVLEHQHCFTDVLHVNYKIWSQNLIRIDLHGNYKITMTSCPSGSNLCNYTLIISIQFIVKLTLYKTRLISLMKSPHAEKSNDFIQQCCVLSSIVYISFLIGHFLRRINVEISTSNKRWKT